MSTELFLDFLAVRMDSKKAEDLEFSINLVTPDNGEKFAIEVANATMTNVEGFLHKDPDLSIVIDRSDLENIMMGKKSFAASIDDGTAKAQGDVDIIAQLAKTLVTFEIGFEILPGTASKAASVDLNPYEVPVESSHIRGE
jgi:alkyl sulfatase BDS1-like metallo-beta-lactamase superfamily hydrolase